MATNQTSLLMITISAVIVTTYASLDANDSIEFGYSGDKGPAKWGSLNFKFKACSDGKAQSPINIVQDKVTQSNKTRTLDRNYKFANATLVNNGFNVAWNAKAQSSYTKKQLEDVQFETLNYIEQTI